jgi:phosphoglucosamine mutase
MTRHVQIRDLDAFQSDPDVIDAFWQIHDSLGEKARFLLRPSGMLPSVRVMVEAPSEQLCAMCLELFMGVLQEKGHFVQLLD